MSNFSFATVVRAVRPLHTVQRLSQNEIRRDDIFLQFYLFTKKTDFVTDRKVKKQ